MMQVTVFISLIVTTAISQPKPTTIRMVVDLDFLAVDGGRVSQLRTILRKAYKVVAAIKAMLPIGDSAQNLERVPSARMKA